MESAIVLSNVRRKIEVLYQRQVLELLIEKKYAALLAGDIINLSEISDQLSIDSVRARTNLIKRSNHHRTKEIVCNLSALLVVTAPPPLFNPEAIDRVITLGVEQDIPVYLVVNKADLNIEDISEEINYYRNIIAGVLVTSAKKKTNLAELEDLISIYSNQSIAVSGVSGVGKSSLLSTILNRQISTNQVSEKTGQGRQTTSKTQGYYYQKANSVLFDVPGIQNFGLAHLSNEFLAGYFTDIAAANCPYRGCSHTNETECQVKKLVESGKILKSRHQSYLSIYQEINFAKEYQWNK